MSRWAVVKFIVGSYVRVKLLSMLSHDFMTGLSADAKAISPRHSLRLVPSYWQA